MAVRQAKPELVVASALNPSPCRSAHCHVPGIGDDEAAAFRAAYGRRGAYSGNAGADMGHAVLCARRGARARAVFDVPLCHENTFTLLFAGLSAGGARMGGAQSLDALVNGEISGLVDTYKGIHEHPELSHHEEHTAALLAGEFAQGRLHGQRAGRKISGRQ